MRTKTASIPGTRYKTKKRTEEERAKKKKEEPPKNAALYGGRPTRHKVTGYAPSWPSVCPTSRRHGDGEPSVSGFSTRRTSAGSDVHPAFAHSLFVELPQTQREPRRRGLGTERHPPPTARSGASPSGKEPSAFLARNSRRTVAHSMVDLGRWKSLRDTPPDKAGTTLWARLHTACKS